ncbi:MAG TPA: PfkB family carbohydrate kinase [Opitutaceae bacterium]|nr:PfkB family carbohydrate kinase [Opitutaceae bacterium]
MSAVPHIFTLTGNLLAERTLDFDTWGSGQTQRAVRETFQVGGKGINVSKMLTRLGAANTALCFAGGFTGAECEAWLRAKNFAVRAFASAAPTRTGTVVRGRGHAETTFLAPDAAPDAAAVRACADFLNEQPGGVLALCGSLPGWDSPDFDVLRAAIHRWPERGALIVDTYGPPLAWLANEAAALVRVNRTELTTLFPPAEKKKSASELLRGSRDRFRVRRWVVSDSGAPVWFMDEHKDPEPIDPPVVKQVSATGSGDVMLACMLHARYERHLSWRDAVAWSLPYAAANAAHPGIAEFPMPKFGTDQA